MPYLAWRSFKVKNLSEDVVNWGFSESDAAFTNPSKVLDAGSQSTQLSPNGAGIRAAVLVTEE